MGEVRNIQLRCKSGVCLLFLLTSEEQLENDALGSLSNYL